MPTPTKGICDAGFIYQGASTHGDPRNFAERMDRYKAEARRLKELADSQPGKGVAPVLRRVASGPNY